MWQNMVLTCLLMHLSLVNISAFNLDPDENRSLYQLISSRGYILQEYKLLTTDGYIITVHRVVPPNYNPFSYNRYRKPVIIFHGILSETTIFYINSPVDNSTVHHCGDNFGFCMLQSGRYDLWVPNARGNRFSRGHVRYTDRDPRFWAYSMNDIAMFDIPAFIGLIQRVTRHQKIGFIGYSQGAATMLMLLSERPEFATIIQPFILWAPAVYVDNAQTIIGPALVAGESALTRLPGEFLLSAQFNNPLLQFAICREPLGSRLCGLIYQLTYGPSVSLNYTRMPTYVHSSPSTISNWQVAHYGQLGAKKQFTKFDYGSARANLRVYGVPYAPLWPLWQIPPMTMIVMYSETDWFVNTIDARRLIGTLRHFGVHVVDHKIPASIWSHTDWLIGKGAGKLIYDPTLRYLDLFTG